MSTPSYGDIARLSAQLRCAVHHVQKARLALAKLEQSKVGGVTPDALEKIENDLIKKAASIQLVNTRGLLGRGER